jgi:hypothetical protein
MRITIKSIEGDAAQKKDKDGKPFVVQPSVIQQ